MIETVQQWWSSQSEEARKALVGGFEYSVAYGLTKAYWLLPLDARAAVDRAFAENLRQKIRDAKEQI